MKKLFFILFFLCAYYCLLAKQIEQKNNKKPELKTEQIDIVEYQVQEQLKPKDLIGISNDQIDDHWNLYKGYVGQVNNLNKQLAQLRLEGKVATSDYANARRRYGFEYNGMVLHEYYFGGMKANSGKPSDDVQKALEKNFGSFDLWKEDFKQTGKMRGIGWAILYYDPMTGDLVDIFVDDHQINNISSFQPIIVMDVWEHAYMVDHRAGGRGDYIDEFMKNINWNVVNQRFKDVKNGKTARRF